MSTTIEVIMRSYEVPEKDSNNLPIIRPFDPVQTRNDFITYSGKAAGICYMPDNYCSEGMKDVQKAMNRAAGNAKNGHYSVYEHAHITMLIHTSKFMAIILNSMYLYSTSEKSARYTQMHPETELEKELYDKWVDKFEAAIKGYYGGLKTDKEVHKLAMENARYLTSVFTPTVMEYTVPYNRAILMVGWMDKYIKNIVANCLDYNDLYISFAKKTTVEIKEFKEELMKVLNITPEDPILTDHKDVYNSIKLFDNSIIELVAKSRSEKIYDSLLNVPFYTSIISLGCSSYDIIYTGSWAQFAQAERHRTIHYSISLLPLYDLSQYDAELYFIPSIIKGSPLEDEWKKDCDTLIKNNIMFQGIKFYIYESGRYDDFVLKVKERLCSRAQFEIMRQTASSLYTIQNKLGSLTSSSIENLNNIMYDKPRCRISGYTCKEPCDIITWALTRKV